MSDFFVSQIRTWVPIGVGAVLTWLADNAGVVVDGIATDAGVMFFTALVSAVYYSLARLIEKQFPWAGYLLGVPSQPRYAEPDMSPS